jgi:hypothetical protein
MKTDLGGFTNPVMSRAELAEIVDIPFSSTILAISPTD